MSNTKKNKDCAKQKVQKCFLRNGTTGRIVSGSWTQSRNQHLDLMEPKQEDEAPQHWVKIAVV